MSRILDEEDLEALCYERSKAWSSFIKCCAEKDEGKAIDTRKFDEIFKDQGEDSVISIDEAKEVCVEDELNQTTQSMTKTELVQMLCSGGDAKEILDQTLPIVEQHVRKWKEAGLDRILNTFDERQIEQHVGDWLRMNNSAYGGNSLLQKSPLKTIPEAYSASSSSDSEVESMHSMDTARYIRASRKLTSKSSIPMRTIKTYRTVAQKRAELRAKYECEEQEHRHHMQVLLYRRNKLHRQKHEHTSFRPQQRIKQLRKRRRTLPIIGPSSSSSEDDHFDCTKKTACSSYTIRRNHNQRGNCRNCHSKRLELESRLRANECRLCNNERLCSNVVHIATSRTETWIAGSTSSSTDKAKRRRMTCKNQSCLRRQSWNESIQLSKPMSEASAGSSNVDETTNCSFEALDVFTRYPQSPTRLTTTVQSDSSKSSIAFCKKVKRNRSMQIPDADSDNSHDPLTSISFSNKVKRIRKMQIPDSDSENTEDLNITVSNQSGELCSINSRLEDTDPKATTPDIIINDIQSDSSKSSSDFSKKLKRVRKMQILNSDSDNSDDLPLQPTEHSVCNNNQNHNSTTSYYSCEPCSINISSEEHDSPTRVSSTIDCSSTVASQRSSFNITREGILLHAPKDQVQNNSSSNFTLTEQVLSPIIGQGRARKLLKYHMGRRSFDSRYHIYYRPSTKMLAKLTDKTEETLALTSSSCSDTDSDIFEMLGRYGVVHPVLEKCKETT
ncbi:hypothetical protein ACLKA6_007371 [Drosophila palustris]